MYYDVLEEKSRGNNAILVKYTFKLFGGKKYNKILF
jgi:hypothetical protein